MAEDKKVDYDELKLTNVNDEGKSVLLIDSADRPNAFNGYTAGKMSARDVKGLFDRSFLYVKGRFNTLLNKLTERDEIVDERIKAQEIKNEEFKKEVVGDITTALDDLHEYAESLISGGDKNENI